MDNRRTGIVPLVVIGLALVAAAVAVFTAAPPTAPNASTVTIADPATTFDPVAAAASLPDGYRIGLARDQIAPVYEPSFTSVDAVDWPEDSLVIGVAGIGEAKAYPVTHLNSREMVIDSLAGIPILVTW